MVSENHRLAFVICAYFNPIAKASATGLFANLGGSVVWGGKVPDESEGCGHFETMAVSMILPSLEEGTESLRRNELKAGAPSRFRGSRKFHQPGCLSTRRKAVSRLPPCHRTPRPLSVGHLSVRASPHFLNRANPAGEDVGLPEAIAPPIG